MPPNRTSAVDRGFGIFIEFPLLATVNRIAPQNPPNSNELAQPLAAFRHWQA
jgi:hypothetical protein